MESEHVIDEMATLEGANIEKVYEDCLAWLTLNKARIREQRRPEYIKAEHGHGRGVSYQDHAKFFLISLNQDGNEVIIDFKIPQLSWAPPSKFPVYSLFWSEFVEDLWRHLEIPIDEVFLRYLYPLKNLRKMYFTKIKGFIFLTLIHGAGLLLGVLLSWLEKKHVTSIILISSFGALSIIGWIITARPMLVEALKIKNQLRELYPDR